MEIVSVRWVSSLRTSESNCIRIDLIGKRIDLKLVLFKSDVAPTFIELISNKQAKEYLSSTSCHYNGYVLHRKHSSASMSLCQMSMNGYVVVDNYFYLIQGNNFNRTQVSRVSITDKMSFIKSRERRSILTNVKFFVKTLVVTDESLLKHFRSEFILTQYVLTLMKMVADIYKSPTMRLNIDISVKKLLVLNDTLFSVTSDPVETLASFCKWVDKSTDAPDVAILLSRTDFCRNTSIGECSTLGLAYQNSVCRDKACAINQDFGFITAFTIAHEIGHTLGMVHDGEENNCSHVSESHDFVMRSTFSYAINVLWSNCSVQSLNNLEFNAPCLRDEPQNVVALKRFPGLLFDPNYQCKIYFGQNYSLCNITSIDFCERLLCRAHNSDTCLSLPQLHLVDGSLCDKNKWCMNGKCVGIQLLSEYPFGFWSPWSSWSECLNGCNGKGVQFRTRTCKSSYKIGCEGSDDEWRICHMSNSTSCYNSGTCTSESPGSCFMICNMSKVFKPDSSVCWTINKAGSFTVGVCVRGVCLQETCDGRLLTFAENQRNECGECPSFDKTCIRVSKLINYHHKHESGYTVIFRIPPNAQHVSIRECNISSNYLALVLNSSYVLNGNFSIKSAGIYYLSNKEEHLPMLTAVYTNEVYEKIFILGPVGGSVLDLSLLVQDDDSIINITYFYSEKHCVWKREWVSNCSNTCNSNEIRRAKIFCVCEGRKVLFKYCDSKKKPSKYEICEKNCFPLWVVGSWSECKGCPNPVQTRMVLCALNDSILLPDSYCSEKKPLTIRSCNYSCSYRMMWYIGEWNGSCELNPCGILHREVRCFEPNAFYCGRRFRPSDVLYCGGPNCAVMN